MSNMSYCRFQNTVSDLKDCRDNMDEGNMSYAERVARWRLIRMCTQISQDYGDEGLDEAKPQKQSEDA